MKLGTFVVLFLCMIMFLEFAGIPTGAGKTLGVFGIEINSESGELTSADAEGSTFWSWIFGTGIGVLVILSVGGAVIVGLFAKSYDTSLVILPLIVSIGGLFASTVWTLIKYMNDFGQAWATSIVAIILAGAGIAFLMSCSDYFAGR